jgi:hypothetical protein
MTRWRYERHDYHPPYRRLPTRQEYEVSAADREPPRDEKPLAQELSAGEYMIQFYLDSTGNLKASVESSKPRAGKPAIDEAPKPSARSRANKADPAANKAPAKRASQARTA